MTENPPKGAVIHHNIVVGDDSETQMVLALVNIIRMNDHVKPAAMVRALEYALERARERLSDS
jgi:hypothetical protein